MAIIRRGQPILTGVVPHQGNRSYAVPKVHSGGPKYQLVWGATTQIVLPQSVVPDLSSQMSYIFEMNLAAAALQDVFESEGGDIRFRVRGGLDWQGTYGTSGAGQNYLTVLWSTGAWYQAAFDANGAGRLDLLQTDSDGNTLSDFKAGFTPTSGIPTSTGMLIGSSGARISAGGIMRNVQMYQSGELIHHWQIDDNVDDGGEITDSVGGAHGTLTLGGGSWEEYEPVNFSAPRITDAGLRFTDIGDLRVTNGN